MNLKHLPPCCDLRCLANHKFALSSTVTRFCDRRVFWLAEGENRFTFLSWLAVVCIHFVGDPCFVYLAVEFRNSPRGQVWESGIFVPSWIPLCSLITRTCSFLQSSVQCWGSGAIDSQDSCSVPLKGSYVSTAKQVAGFTELLSISISVRFRHRYTQT